MVRSQNDETLNKNLNNKLSDSDLLKHLHKIVQDERNSTLEVIRLLSEVNFRSLYLTMGYGSLIEFCIKQLKYSESASYRRVSAMRLAQEVTQIEESIKSGDLNLSVIAQAQTFVRREEKH